MWHRIVVFLTPCFACVCVCSMMHERAPRSYPGAELGPRGLECVSRQHQHRHLHIYVPHNLECVDVACSCNMKWLATPYRLFHHRLLITVVILTNRPKLLPNAVAAAAVAADVVSAVFSARCGVWCVALLREFVVSAVLVYVPIYIYVHLYTANTYMLYVILIISCSLQCHLEPVFIYVCCRMYGEHKCQINPATRSDWSPRNSSHKNPSRHIPNSVCGPLSCVFVCIIFRFIGDKSARLWHESALYDHRSNDRGCARALVIFVFVCCGVYYICPGVKRWQICLLWKS